MLAHVSNETFVDRFAAAWGSRDANQLGALLHSDVVLEGPLMPVLRGRAMAVYALGQFLKSIPDLQITIHDSMLQNNVVFIAFSFRGTVGRRRLEWQLVDRIELEDGLVRARVAYFDPRPLTRALALRPATWWQLARRGLRKLRGPRTALTQ
jgi:ketosteroid isomerase-like protein